MSTPLRQVGAILFDLDGVLVDSRAPIAGSINHALVRHGFAERPAAELHARIGDTLHSIFVGLLGERGRDEDLVQGCIAAYRERYRTASVEETTLFPGIEASLRTLGAARPLAVATSKPVEFADPILARLGVRDCFRVVVGPPLAAERGETKQRVAERALAALGVPAVALVGDRHHDVRAARALGLAAVGVTWGIGTEHELRTAGATHLVPTPSALPPLFEG